MAILPWVSAAFNIGSQIFDRSRAGYETSPQKKAFLDSVHQEQRIFDRDSAYNSPEAQMKRFRDAGLNPNLIYGQGNPGNTSGSAPQASGNIPRTDVMGGVLESMMMEKELEVKDAQIDNIRANTSLITEKSGSEEWKQRRMEQDLQYLEQNYPELLNRLRRENRIGTDTEQIQKLQSATDLQKTQTDVLKGTEDVERQRRENRIGTKTEDYQVQKVQADAIHAGQLISTELMRQGLMERDGKIRNEVLKSKQLQNIIMDMQTKFVTEGKMNPQMFWQAFLNTLSGALIK